MMNDDRCPDDINPKFTALCDESFDITTELCEECRRLMIEDTLKEVGIPVTDSIIERILKKDRR